MNWFFSLVVLDDAVEETVNALHEAFDVNRVTRDADHEL